MRHPNLPAKHRLLLACLFLAPILPAGYCHPADAGLSGCEADNKTNTERGNKKS